METAQPKFDAPIVRGSTSLENADDRRTEGGGDRFDLGAMVCARVRIRILAHDTERRGGFLGEVTFGRVHRDNAANQARDRESKGGHNAETPPASNQPLPGQNLPEIGIHEALPTLRCLTAIRHHDRGSVGIRLKSCGEGRFVSLTPSTDVQPVWCSVAAWMQPTGFPT